MRTHARCWFVFGIIWTSAAFAQLSPQDVSALKSQGKALGWTFSVDANAATAKSKEQLCGLAVPDHWWVGAPFTPFRQKADLPAAYDWRAHNGCTPIKNQWNCGSCWAFATVGAFECNIKIRDGQTVNLSEQWLINCNQETSAPHVLGGTWGCGGGWWAHDYHDGASSDPCGGSGAVLTAYLPYRVRNEPCQCPYPHDYAFDSWAFVGEMEGIPEPNAIKQAILAYGPITAAVYVGNPFMGYTGGVFNANENAEVNHGIVLVGWDDNQGTNGVWILRNSWSNEWGEEGYMRIEYGCCGVGYGACYIDYAGKGNGIPPVITGQPASGTAPLRWRHTFSVAATGVGTLHYQWEHNGQPVGTDSPTLLVDNASEQDEGAYTCLVTDARGTALSQPASLSIDALQQVPAARPAGLLAIMAACMLLFPRLWRAQGARRRG